MTDHIPGTGTTIWHHALHIFERQIQLFPLLVVILACSSFLFGGCCSLWQWWIAVIVVIATPFATPRPWQSSLAAAALFSVLLLVLKYLLPPVLWDNACCVDMQSYHLPMIQLLIEGWNPVADPLAESIVTRLGLDLWGMSPILVIFYGKTMAVLAAVAYKFTGDPTGLTIPGLSFLWLGVAIQVLRQFRGTTRWMALASLIWVLPTVRYRMYVDLSLAFASCGLFFGMLDDLKRKRCNWLRLGTWATWMATIKLNGLLGAFVFCAAFAFVQIWVHRSRWVAWSMRFAGLSFAVAFLTGLILWNPLGTTWKAYGHPLYPFSTVDAVNYPVQDPTWEHRVVNGDCREMGRWALWLHQYVSPRWVNSHFRRVSGREDFEARSIWFHGQYMSQKARMALFMVFGLLFLHPKGRLFAISGLLTTILVPWEKIGFLRYLPWLNALGCLAVALAVEWIEEKWGFLRWLRWRNSVLFCVFMAAAMRWGIHHARGIEFKATESSLVRDRIRCRIWMAPREPVQEMDPTDFVPRYNCMTTMENHCRLLVREAGLEGRTQVLSANGLHPAETRYRRRPVWKWDERQWFLGDAQKDIRCIEDLGEAWHEVNIWDGYGPIQGMPGEPWVMTPWWLYYVPWNDWTDHLVEYYHGAEAKDGETEVKRISRIVSRAAQIWFCTYPHEVWKIFRGKKFATMGSKCP